MKLSLKQIKVFLSESFDNLRQELKRSDLLVYLYREFLVKKHRLYVKTNPEKSINILFRRKFNREVNLLNPKNLIEKIYWMSFHTDTTLWSKCADKYDVRNYVEKNGCGYMLNTLYAHYYSIEDINFEELPHEYVLKSNNACATVLIVKNNDMLNQSKTKKTLKRWMNYKFGYFNAQLHYLRIRPCIIAEKYLIKYNTGGKSLIDYKFTCFYGIPESILVCSDRNINGDQSYVLNLYDINWNPLNDLLTAHKNSQEIAKPISFYEMIDACMKLGKDFPYVRIDFYEVDERPIFGEMTFTTAYDYFTPKYYDYLGSKIDLKKLKLTEQSAIFLKKYTNFSWY